MIFGRLGRFTVSEVFPTCRKIRWAKKRSYLLASEIENRVVDWASIEVMRRAKRVKTDRLEAGSWRRCW
jgi:hypothetical protein